MTLKSLLVAWWVLSSPGAALAQAGDAGAAARKSFGEVSGWVLKAAQMVPADKYAYKPAPTVRSYGQLVGHVVDGLNFYCAQAAGKKLEWSDAAEKGAVDKATLAPKLSKAIDACTAAYGASGPIGPMIENVGHTSLHYGNMITYIRMLGLVPPSS